MVKTYRELGRFHCRTVVQLAFGVLLMNDGILPTVVANRYGKLTQCLPSRYLIKSPRVEPL